MSHNSTMHAYLSWAKERIEEMNGALASLEAKAGKLEGDSKVLGSQIIAELRKYRDEFRATVDKLATINETSWTDSKKELENIWGKFQAQVRKYLETVGKSIEQKYDTFTNVASAQARAWHNTAAELQEAATNLASSKRAEVDMAMKRMAIEAEEAKVRLQGMKQAGSESWSAFSVALDTSRKAFDEANQQAWDAFQRAMHPK